MYFGIVPPGDGGQLLQFMIASVNRRMSAGHLPPEQSCLQKAYKLATCLSAQCPSKRTCQKAFGISISIIDLGVHIPHTMVRLWNSAWHADSERGTQMLWMQHVPCHACSSIALQMVSLLV